MTYEMIILLLTSATNIVMAAALRRKNRELRVARDYAASAFGRELAAGADLLKSNNALRQIRDTTADGKSGTAQRVHRVAKEALSDDGPVRWAP